MVADNQYRANKPGGGHVAFGSKEFLEMATVHAVTVKDHICYAAVANFGACQIDVSDPTNPQLIGYLPMNPPFGGGAAGMSIHTYMPLGDLPYAVVSTEGERPRYFSNENKDGLFKKACNTANEYDWNCRNYRSDKSITYFYFPISRSTCWIYSWKEL